MGRNSLEGASQQIKDLGLTKALIVTDAVSDFTPRALPLCRAPCLINSTMACCAVYQHCRAHAQVLVKVGAIKAVTSILERIGIQYSIYDGVEPNPTIEQVPK